MAHRGVRFISWLFLIPYTAMVFIEEVNVNLEDSYYSQMF